VASPKVEAAEPPPTQAAAVPSPKVAPQAAWATSKEDCITVGGSATNMRGCLYLNRGGRTEIMVFDATGRRWE
jgi:hypothetical protein